MRTTLLATLSLLTALVSADKNVTVEDTDTSVITYNDKVQGEASICRIAEDGTILSQPGCYNVQPSNCTEGATVGRGTGAGVSSFKFYGSAIYINSLLLGSAPMYNVTLDGVTESVDGVRESLAFGCFPLWSKTGLDAQKEHEISVIAAGLSPSASQDLPVVQQWTDESAVFFLDSFVVTVTDDADGINGSPKSSTESSESETQTPAASDAESNTEENSEGDTDGGALPSTSLGAMVASMVAGVGALLL